MLFSFSEAQAVDPFCLPLAPIAIVGREADPTVREDWDDDFDVEDEEITGKLKR